MRTELYYIATDERFPLPIRYEMARMLQQTTKKKVLTETERRIILRTAWRRMKNRKRAIK